MENTSNAPEHSAPVSTSCSSRWRVLFCWAIAFLLVIWVGVVAYQAQHAQQELHILQHQMRLQWRQQQQNAQFLHQSLQQLQQQSQQQQTQLIQLSQQTDHLMQQATGNNVQWKMAEVVYLVRLADMQLKVQHAIPTALTLLKQAEETTRTLAKPNLVVFHQALIKNINSLQNLSAIDVLNLVNQLNTLQTQVPTLSLLVAPKPGTSPLADSTHQQHKKWWQRAWNNIKASFKALVIVRHEDQPLPALMPPEEQTYLQQNLQLLLVQARWALLNHQMALYQNSIKEAMQWIKKFYVQNSATTQTFLKQLENLQAMNIAPPLPDLTHTLSLLPQE